MRKISKYFLILFLIIFITIIFSQPIYYGSKELAKKILPENIINILRTIKNPTSNYSSNDSYQMIELTKTKEILELSDFKEKEQYLNKAFMSHKYEIEFNKSEAMLDVIDENDNIINSINAKKYSTNALSHGQNNKTKSSAYINPINNTNEFIITSKDGVILHLNINEEKILSSTIPNNLRDLITFEEFYSDKRFGIKDASIFDGNLFIGFTNKHSENCFNTSVAYANLNTSFLNFEMLFSPDDCVRSDNPEKNQFSANQVGGRIEKYSEGSFLLTIGDFRDRPIAQDMDKVFGKILKINYENFNDKLKLKDYSLVASGSRNSQGLHYDEYSGKAIFSDHGPDGGDEINIIKNFLGNTNYGWPISSYGEHYYNTPEIFFADAPFHKSHKDYGFEEPLYYFTPSIAVSELELYRNNNNDGKITLFLSSLGYTDYKHERSIHQFSLDDNFEKIIREKIIKINERIRDLIIHNQKLILYLDNSSTIMIIEIDQLIN